MSSGGSVTARSTSASVTIRSNRPPADEPVEQALVRPDVGVLQVDGLEAGRAPVQAVAGAVALEDRQLGHPVELPGQRHRVGLQPGQHRLPAVQHVGGHRVGVGAVAVLDVLARLLGVLHLQLHGGQRAAGAQRDQLRAASGRATRRAASPPAGRPSRSTDRKPSSIIASTSDVRAELEVGRDLGEVGVADDDVQPAVLLGDGVRLVAGVDDRALQRRLEADLDLEVVGALGDLEAVAAAVLADADPAGAAHDLPGDEERREVPDDLGERRLPAHQVVLVRAVGGALVVGVVLVQVDRRRVGHLRGPPAGLGHDPLAGLVPDAAASRGLVHSGEQYSGCAWST